MADDALKVLFTPLQLGGVTLRNRIGMSPMCQYSAIEGVAQEWHHAHLGARAQGGLGLIMVEATGVMPAGRITPGCLGLWNDQQRDALKPLAAVIKSQGVVPGIQLAHAGRKAACALPWQGGRQLSVADGGWETMAPSALPFRTDERAHRAMTTADIAVVRAAFVAAAERALAAGFELIEIHAAHGYLLHSFLSPLSNQRDDAYGGDLAGRSRLLLEVVADLRALVPASHALAVRLSCSDWVEGGLSVEDCVIIAQHLKTAGVDLVDCSSGGLVVDAKIPGTQPGYQVPFARALRQEAGIATAAVGMITTPPQAAEIIQQGNADMVFLARVLLRDPYWALKAAAATGIEIPVPPQYLRGIDRDSLLTL